MAKVPGVGYVSSLIDEGKKVIWPKRDVIVRHTALVVVTIAIATLLFGGLDFGLQKLVILSLGNN